MMLRVCVSLLFVGSPIALVAPLFWAAGTGMLPAESWHYIAHLPAVACLASSALAFICVRNDPILYGMFASWGYIFVMFLFSGVVLFDADFPENGSLYGDSLFIQMAIASFSVAVIGSIWSLVFMILIILFFGTRKTSAG